MESAYLKMLLVENPDVGKRYQDKLRIINGLDPYILDVESLNFSIDGVPPITNMDIVSYLVLTHSFHTKEQMKAYKSLQAYKYFEAGFVVKAGTKMINNLYLLIGKVKHSQRHSAKPLEVWCIVGNDGDIHTSHCTCMAGNSETCSHVGAVLFAAEYAYKKKEEISCTDIRSLWSAPSTSGQIPIVPVRDMNWGRPVTTVERKELPSLTTDEIKDMLQDISDADETSVLMRILEPFAQKVAANISTILPSALNNIYDKANLKKSHAELMFMSKNITMEINREQRTKIEELTRKQSANQNWYIQKAGRITASKFKLVCRTNKNKPSLSLIKSICYPTKILFNIKAIQWGLVHENDAVEQYKTEMEKENHDSLIINEVGIVVSTRWPQFGASPDRLVFCECCQGGCVEVKCPYLLFSENVLDIHEYLKMKSSCLLKENNKILLNKKHTYYFQVQMQIFVTELEYCDFIIWSPNIFFKQRILPDWEFWKRESIVALKFHEEVIMPELLGRFFTKDDGVAEIIRWCICKGVDDGRPMIECSGDDCETKWFHFLCVGLADTPNNVWYCQNCEEK